jgi:REP element-mobilizing transposase RayT
MPHPIVIAHHLVWTVYGRWLPNDPRGSNSHSIGSEVIAELGDLHRGRKKVQPAGWVIRDFYQRAKEVLIYPLLTFDATERDEVGAAFASVIEAERYTCYACAVMPDHVHLLIRKHKHTAEEMIDNFQRASRIRLADAQLRTTDHPTWGGPGWKVFLDHPDEVRRTITYIEKNPLPLRLPKQVWSFVKEYDGWPLHPGHSSNSPYVKALKAAGRLGS